jgi:hypothetical protein
MRKRWSLAGLGVSGLPDARRVVVAGPARERLASLT